MQEVAQRVKTLSQELADADAELQSALSTLPNPPDPTAADEDTTLREEGRRGAAGRDHLEVAGPLIDMESGARVSGSRFAYLRGDLVLLEMALFRWALDVLGEEGFEPVVPPVLVREEALYGTGFLPDTEQQIYRLADDDLYLVGTSEVPLASLHAGEILEDGSLPRRYAGISPCFRREAGAAGRDTRGILRVHQFDKVEMFSFVEPEEATDEHELLLALEERFLRELEIPYRVVNIGADDLGASAAKKYDLEAWMPGQEQLPRGHLDLEHHRLPVAPARHPLPRRRRPPAPRLHAQRHGGHLAAHDRAAGEPPGEIPDVLRRWGAPARLRVGGRVMERETPITPEDPDIPAEPPDPDAVEPEVDDQPLGPPADLDEDDAPLPGLPESEPPAAD